MKVLMWMDGSFDRRTPSEHLLVAVIQALYANGHTVHVIQRNTGGPLQALPDDLVRLGVTTESISCKLAAKNNFIGRYLVGLKYIWQCRKALLQNKDCEAVFNQSSNAAGFMVLFIKLLIPKARIIYNVQDIFPDNAAYIGKVNGIAYKILLAEQQFAYKHANKIITISEDMKDLLVEKGIDSQKIEVIYNWSYSDEPYRQEDVYSEKIAEFLPANKYNVVYAGNIGAMQNVEVVVDAARLMRDRADIHFHIFGDGLYKNQLQDKAKDLTNISFWPMQPSELAPSIYSMADVNIIPLAPNIYRTALPSKTATCIACGKPIVFCFGKNSKLQNKLEQDSSFVFTSSNDASQLVAAILELKHNFKDRAFLNKLFLRFFVKSKNANMYARIITGESK